MPQGHMCLLMFHIRHKCAPIAVYVQLFSIKVNSR